MTIADSLRTIFLASLFAGCVPPGPGITSGPTGVKQWGWRATFPVAHKDIGLASAGVYIGGETPIQLDSCTLSGMPNATGKWTITPNAKEPTKGEVVYRDFLQAAHYDDKRNVIRDKGSIAAVVTVHEAFSDVNVRVTVNTTGGIDHQGSFIRQGPMIRWDGGDRFMACFLDFASGEVYLRASRTDWNYQHFGTQQIRSFDNKKRYTIDASMTGQTARCKILDGKELVADTGDVTDAQSPASGLVGLLFEVSERKPEVILEASFTELSATSMHPPVKTPEPPAVPSGEAVTAYQQAKQIAKEQPKKALELYDRAITLQPDYFDALNDKAWLLATSSDATIRNPKLALEFAIKAKDSIAMSGMLRKNRDAFAELHTTGRIMIANSTYAAALAGVGRFNITPAEAIAGGVPLPGASPEAAGAPAAMVAGGACGDSAMAVMDYVVQNADRMHTQFSTASTRTTFSNAQKMLDMYRQGQVPIGMDQIAPTDSPVTRLR